MSNNLNLTCVDVAKAVKNLMVYANFSGFINQPEKGGLLQFSVQEPICKDDIVTMELEIGGKSFVMTICGSTTERCEVCQPRN